MYFIFANPSADDLLKATVLREIEIPGYTRADGTYVPPHRKHVHVNPDVSQEDVLGGRGSHSQREAVNRLRRQEWFQNLSPEHRYHHVLSHATDIQLRRSAAAALSRQRAAAGTARDEPAAPARESAVPAREPAARPAPAAPAAPAAEDSIAALIERANGGDARAMALVGVAAVRGSLAATRWKISHGRSDSVAEMRDLNFTIKHTALDAMNVVYVPRSTQLDDTADIGRLRLMLRRGDVFGIVEAQTASDLGRDYRNALLTAAAEAGYGLVYTDAGEVRRTLLTRTSSGWRMQEVEEDGHAPVPATAAPEFSSREADDGPHEGDTKVENGHTYRLTGGRWHRVDQDQAASESAGAAASPMGTATASAPAGGGSVFPADHPYAGYSRGLDGRWRDAENVPVRRNSARERGLNDALSAMTGGSASTAAIAGGTRETPVHPVDAVADQFTGAPPYDPAAAAPSAPAPTNPPSTMAAAQASVPEPPNIRGANPNNTALIAAQRKVLRMYDIARTSNNPVGELMAMRTSLGNSYLAAAHNYRRQLLQHFGYSVDGTAIREGALQPTPAPAPARPAPARPATAPPTLANASQNPIYASNPEGKPISELGFVPRPNVPLNVRLRPGGWLVPAGQQPATLIPWRDENFRILAQAYLGQSVGLQLLARQSQAMHPSRTMHNEIVEGLANAHTAGQAARDAATASAAEERRALMERTREVSSQFLDTVRNLPELYQPRRPVGGNITSWMPDTSLAKVGEVLGLGVDETREFVGRMISDYGDDPDGNKITFKVSLNSSREGYVNFSFKGSDGTFIARELRRDQSGNLTVKHALFSAGRTTQDYHTYWMNQIPVPSSDGWSYSVIHALDKLMHARSDDERIHAWNPEAAGVISSMPGYAELMAYHAKLVEASNRPNLSGGKGLFRASLGAYKALGFKRISVHANISVGGYAWAKYGFMITQSSWDGKRGRWKAVLQTAVNNGEFSRTAARKVFEALDKSDPRGLWVVADAMDGEKSIGKHLLLRSDWHGDIDMDENSESMRRCLGYIALRR